MSKGLPSACRACPRRAKAWSGIPSTWGPGGKGTNQAIAAARLGAEVQLLDCLGDDGFGARALQLYSAERLDTDHIHQVAGAHTGIGFVNVLPDGENWITVDMGAMC